MLYTDTFYTYRRFGGGRCIDNLTASHSFARIRLRMPRTYIAVALAGRMSKYKTAHKQ